MATYSLTKKSARLITKQVSDAGIRASQLIDGVVTSETGINEVFPGELLFNNTDGVFSTVDNNGNLVEISPSNPSMGSLLDVDLTGLTDEQILQYDASNSTWYAVDLPGLNTYDNGLNLNNGVAELGGSLNKNTLINGVDGSSPIGKHFDYILEDVDFKTRAAGDGNTFYQVTQGQQQRGFFSMNEIDVNSTDWTTGGDIGNNLLTYTSDFSVRAHIESSITPNSQNAFNYITSRNASNIAQIGVTSNTNGNLIYITDESSDVTKKGIYYRGISSQLIDYSLGWDNTTDDSILATKGYVDRAAGGGGAYLPLAGGSMDEGAVINWNVPDYNGQMIIENGQIYTEPSVDEPNDFTDSNAAIQIVPSGPLKLGANYQEPTIRLDLDTNNNDLQTLFVASETIFEQFKTVNLNGDIKIPNLTYESNVDFVIGLDIDGNVYKTDVSSGGGSSNVFANGVQSINGVVGLGGEITSDIYLGSVNGGTKINFGIGLPGWSGGSIGIGDYVDTIGVFSVYGDEVNIAGENSVTFETDGELDFNSSGVQFKLNSTLDKAATYIQSSGDSNKKGIYYTNDYSLGWDNTTDDGVLATKGYVDRAVSSGGGGGSSTTPNLLDVLTEGDYAEHGDTSYYLGVDGFTVDGTDNTINYLMDVNSNYTQISRTDDSDPLDQSSILLDSDGILFESSNVIEFNLENSGVNMIIKTPTTEIKYLDSYTDMFGNHENVITETIGTISPTVDYYQSRLYKMNGIGLANSREINSTTEYTLDYIEDAIISNPGNVKLYNRVISEGGYLSSAMGVQALDDPTASRGIYFAADPFQSGTNDGSFIKDTLSDLNKRGIKYVEDYSLNWDIDTPDNMLATKGYVDDTVANSGGSGTLNFNPPLYDQFPTGTDKEFYNDGTIKLNWNAPSNRLEMTMLVAPGGTGDLRTLCLLDGGSSSQNTYITQINSNYVIFSPGVSAGGRLDVTIGAEQDDTYPFYRLTVYNLGNSYNTSVIIEKY